MVVFTLTCFIENLCLRYKCNFSFCPVYKETSMKTFVEIYLELNTFKKSYQKLIYYCVDLIIC